MLTKDNISTISANISSLFDGVKISDDIRGYVNITKDIKIQVKEQPNQAKAKQGASFMGDMFFFGLLGAALIGLLFVIRYFFL